MTPIKQRRYWREEMKAAKKAMELYPVGSDEREIYRAKYNEALKHYNDLFEEVYYGRKVNTRHHGGGSAICIA